MMYELRDRTNSNRVDRDESDHRINQIEIRFQATFIIL